MRTTIKGTCLPRILFILLGTVALTWPLLYNGSPLLLGDSVGYCQNALRATIYPTRPSFYPFLLSLGVFTGSICSVCILQSILMAVTLEIALIRVANLSYRMAVPVVALLGICTTAPWWASALMPDIFFGIAVVAAASLLFGHSRLTLLDHFLLWPILGISLLQHVALPPVLIAASGVILLMGLFRRRTFSWSTFAIVLLSLAGYFSYPLLNYIAGNGLYSSTHSDEFILCRMAGDKLISESDFAAFTRNAPDRQQDLFTRFHQTLNTPPNQTYGYLSPESARNAAFYHDPNSPFALWTTDARLPSFRDMILHLLRQKPGPNLAAVARGSFRLFMHGEIPVFIENFRASLAEPLQNDLPSDYKRYIHSRQVTATLHLPAWNEIIVPLYWLAIATFAAASFVTLAYWRTAISDPCANRLRQIAAFLFAFVILHAFLVFALSGDFPRYQSRFSFILVLSGIFAAFSTMHTLRNRNNASTRHVTPLPPPPN